MFGDSKEVKDLHGLYENISYSKELKELNELVESAEFLALTEEEKRNMLQRFQDKLSNSRRAGFLGQLERTRRKVFGTDKERNQANTFDNENEVKAGVIVKREEPLNTKGEKEKIDLSKEIESDSNYAKSNRDFNDATDGTRKRRLEAEKKAAQQKAALDAGAVERQDKPTASVKSQIDAYQKGRPSPASFNTNQRQTRDLVKSQSKQVYPSITNKDLNQFSRSKKYTADDGKTQVDRSTVFTKAKFDFGNIKKGQELGVMGKKQRQQYDLKAASFKEEVAIDENRMASHTAGMSDAQKDAATSSVSRSTADKMGRRSDEAAFKGRKKKTSARYSSTGGKKRKNTTGRGQPEQYRKSADSPENEGRYPYGRSKIVQGKGSIKGLKKEDFDAFDIVLGYLQESGQVDSIDEALYVMMEMDAATIQSIVKDFELLAEEAADKVKDDRLVKYGIGHDGSDKKGGSGRRSGKKPKGKTPLQKESEKKYGKGKTAVDIVRAKIEKEHGKGAIAD